MLYLINLISQAIGSTSGAVVGYIVLAVIAILVIIAFVVILWLLYKLLVFLGPLLVSGLTFLFAKLRELISGRVRKAGEGISEVYAVGPQDNQSRPILQVLRRLNQKLRRHGRSTDPYLVPWYVVLGSPGCGKSALIAESNLGFPFGETGVAADADCQCWLTGEAVLIEVNGELLKGRLGRRKFATLMREIAKVRPRRPLDGMILVTAAAELVQGSQGDGASLTELSQGFQSAFSTCDEHIGFRLPVYIVVSQMDAMNGFLGFASGLDPVQRRGLFGWSSAYHPEQPFERTWLNEAFRNVGRDLRNLWLTQYPAPEVDNAGIELPSRIDLLREPIAVVASRLFAGGRHFHAFALRGVYLSGRVSAELGNIEERFFLHDLFPEKILPERGLSQPSPFQYETATQRHRLVTSACLAGMLVVGAGTAYGISQTQQSLSALNSALTTLQREAAQSLPPLAREQGLVVRPDTLVITRAVGMAEALGDLSLRNLLVPASWFSALSSQTSDAAASVLRGYIIAHLSQAMKIRLQRVVEGGEIDQGLSDNAEALGGALGGGPLAVAVPASAQGDPLRRVEIFLSQLSTAEDRLSDYEQLVENPAQADLPTIISYAFGPNLGWPTNLSGVISDYYAQELGLETIDRDQIVQTSQQTIAQLMEAYRRERYINNDLARIARNIEDLALLVRDQPESASLKDLSNLRDQLDSATHNLRQSTLLWLVGAKGGDTGSDLPLNTAIVRIIANPLLGLVTGGVLKLEASDARDRARRDITSFQVPLFGVVFEREGEDSELRVAESAREYANSLNTFLQSPFLFGEVRERISEISLASGEPITWDVPQLSRAVRRGEAFDAYFANPDPNLTRDLGPVLQRLAGDRFGMILTSETARAVSSYSALEARFGAANTEGALVQSTANFAQARQLLEQLVAYLTNYAPNEATALQQLMGEQIASQLEQAYTVLQQEDPYSFVQLITAASRTGTPGDTGATFGVESRLNEARERIQLLYDDFVQANLELIKGQRQGTLVGSSRRIIQEWTDIGQSLDGYRRRESGNQILMIEQMMRQLTLPDGPALCEAASAAVIQQTGFAGYLDVVMEREASALKERCSSWQERVVLNSLYDFSDFYTDFIHGQIPFAKPTESTRYVSLPAFSELLRRYTVLQETIAGVGIKPEGEDWEGFTRQMGTLIATFPAGESEFQFVDVRADLRVRFRANPSQELLADQIIEWRLTSGTTRVGARQSDQIIAWQHGQPVRLRLRWARGSPYRPSLVGDEITANWQSLDEWTVEQTFADPWALFSFVEQHFDTTTPDGGVLLRVELPVYRQATQGSDQDALKMVSFIQILFFKNEVPVTAPDFPLEAPVRVELQGRSRVITARETGVAGGDTTSATALQDQAATDQSDASNGL